MLRHALEDLTQEDFGRAPGASAPPIGWHLWHVARWGDRFQAGIANPDAPAEVWAAERLAEAWGLNPAELGVLELGMGMDAEKAQALPARIGKRRFESYLERVLDALHVAISESDPALLMAPRMSIREYATVNGVIQYAPPAETTLFADILFHLTHSGRHIGSVEALRGL
jgi:DinB family protein